MKITNACCIISSPRQTETVEEPIEEDAEAAEEPEKEAEEEAEVEEEEEDKEKPKTKKVGVHKVVDHMDKMNVVMAIKCTLLKYYNIFCLFKIT